MSVLGTDTPVSSNCLCFHCLLESSKRPQWAAILFSEEFSSLRHSPSLNRLNRAINSAHPISKRQRRYRPLRTSECTRLPNINGISLVRMNTLGFHLRIG